MMRDSAGGCAKCSEKTRDDVDNKPSWSPAAAIPEPGVSAKAAWIAIHVVQRFMASVNLTPAPEATATELYRQALCRGVACYWLGFRLPHLPG